MATYRIFPEKDATVYSYYPTMNTGIDEILEVGNYLENQTVSVARTLIQFSNQDIATAVALTTGSYTASLGLNMATITNLASETPIEVYLITGSWQNGTGKYQDLPIIENGVNWETVLGSGSFINSQTFGYRTTLDVNLDVTKAVNGWVNATSSNNGLLLKLTGSFEFSDSASNQPKFKYFSVDTNTIYPPYIDIKWDDSVYQTSGSRYQVVSDVNLICSIDNLGTYYPESKQRFFVNCRPQYPQRTFTTSSLYTQNYLMPSQSYYSIVDLKTNEVVFGFDVENSKVSVTPESNYFDIYMNGLQPERWYQIQIKTDVLGSTVVLSPTNNTFKVINR